MRGGQIPEAVKFENSLPVAAIVDEYLATGRRKIEAWCGSRYESPGEHRQREPGAFHMSGATCLREQMFKREDAPAIPIQGISLRRFAVGNLVENVLEAAFRWKGVLVDAQTMVWRDWAFRAGRGHYDSYLGSSPERGPYRVLRNCLIVGTLDAVLQWTPEWASHRGPITVEMQEQGKVWRTAGDSRRPMIFVVDWKTVRADKLDYVDSEPDEGYFLQIASYAKTWAEQYRKEYDQVRLIYVDKDAIRMKQVGVDMEEWGPRAVLHWHRQRDAAEKRMLTGTLPPELPVQGEGEKSKPHWKCDPRYCGFAVARDASGQFLCPTVGGHWENVVAEQKKRSRTGDLGQYGYHAEALHVGAALHGPVTEPPAPDMGPGEAADVPQEA